MVTMTMGAGIRMPWCGRGRRAPGGRPRLRFPAVRAAVAAAALVVAACGSGERSSFERIDYPRERIPVPPEVLAFYAEHPDFFVFAEPGDLPPGLEWQDGSGLPEIGSPKAKKGGTYYYYIPDFPRTLRFVGPEANGAFRSYILDNNALALTMPHPNDLRRHLPVLARRWAVSEDGRTVYYQLDPDATYSDGVPVRADDYLYLFYWMRSEWITDPWYNDHYSTQFERITKFDDLTIAVTLPQAKPDLLYRAAIRPVPMHFYRQFADDYVEHYQWQFEPTTGAYEVRPENIDRGRSITLTRVEDWWAADKEHFRYRFNPDRLHLTVVRDPNKAWEIFLKGELALFPVALPEFWYQKLPDDHRLVEGGYIHKVQFYNEIPRPTWGLIINRSKPLLDNRDIRVGLQHALNWELVLDQVFYGDYERMNSVADGYGEASNPDVRARGFSVEKAEEAFARAGFTRRGTDGILQNDKGERLSFTVTTGYKPLADVLTVLQQEARKAGVDLQIEMLEMTASWKKIDEKKHEIALGAKNVSVELYPRFWETFHSSNARNPDGSVKTDTNNETVTDSKELDAMIDAYRESADWNEIVRLSREMIAWLHDDAAFVPAWVKPWYRVAHWEWVGWPDDFDLKTSRDFEEFMVFWIDDEKKEEVRRAMKEGRKLPKTISVYDQHKPKP